MPLLPLAAGIWESYIDGSVRGQLEREFATCIDYNLLLSHLTGRVEFRDLRRSQIVQAGAVCVHALRAVRVAFAGSLRRVVPAEPCGVRVGDIVVYTEKLGALDVRGKIFHGHFDLCRVWRARITSCAVLLGIAHTRACALKGA